MRIEFNDKGFKELLTSEPVKAGLKPYADEIAEKANAIPSITQPAATEPYYEVVDGTDEDRARYYVQTANPRAINHEKVTDALLRGLGG
ncbi:hypothetical protein R2325_14025 [Mycobacteroides chelonae]|nr:hypothetical protein [Mycobacteroides chelonae]MEC4873143.1 hypothetical protein [Mycobacteroides chelonae]